MQKISLYPQDIYKIDCEDKFSYLLKEAYSVKQDYNNDYPTPELMYASKNRNIFNTLPSFYSLKNFISNSLKNITNKNFIFTSSWINFSYKYNYQEMHSHPDADIVGVYYISYPVNSGKILLYNKYNPRQAEFITPYGGLLLLFNADQPHSVEQSFSDEPRIALPFNINFIK